MQKLISITEHSLEKTMAMEKENQFHCWWNERDPFHNWRTPSIYVWQLVMWKEIHECDGGGADMGCFNETHEGVRRAMNAYREGRSINCAMR